MKIRKGSLSDILLQALENTVEGLVLLEDMTYHSYKYTRGLISSPNKTALSEAIRRLREKGYLEKEINVEKKIILRLTSLGREYLGKDQVVWDGKYRVVIWDIPENKRRLRDLFRRRLKEWGFKSFQRSVWVSQKNVTESLRGLIYELGIENWVVVLETDEPALGSLLKV